MARTGLTLKTWKDCFLNEKDIIKTKAKIDIARKLWTANHKQCYFCQNAFVHEELFRIHSLVEHPCLYMDLELSLISQETHIYSGNIQGARECDVTGLVSDSQKGSDGDSNIKVLSGGNQSSEVACTYKNMVGSNDMTDKSVSATVTNQQSQAGDIQNSPVGLHNHKFEILDEEGEFTCSKNVEKSGENKIVENPVSNGSYKSHLTKIRAKVQRARKSVKTLPTTPKNEITTVQRRTSSPGSKSGNVKNALNRSIIHQGSRSIPIRSFEEQPATGKLLRISSHTTKIVAQLEGLLANPNYVDKSCNMSNNQEKTAIANYKIPLIRKSISPKRNRPKSRILNHKYQTDSTSLTRHNLSKRKDGSKERRSTPTKRSCAPSLDSSRQDQNSYDLRMKLGKRAYPDSRAMEGGDEDADEIQAQGIHDLKTKFERRRLFSNEFMRNHKQGPKCRHNLDGIICDNLPVCSQKDCEFVHGVCPNGRECKLYSTCPLEHENSKRPCHLCADREKAGATSIPEQPDFRNHVIICRHNSRSRIPCRKYNNNLCSFGTKCGFMHPPCSCEYKGCPGEHPGLKRLCRGCNKKINLRQIHVNALVRCTHMRFQTCIFFPTCHRGSSCMFMHPHCDCTDPHCPKEHKYQTKICQSCINFMGYGNETRPNKSCS